MKFYFFVFYCILAIVYISNKKDDFDNKLIQKWYEIEQMNTEYFKLVSWERRFSERNFRYLFIKYQKLYIQKNKG